MDELEKELAESISANVVTENDQPLIPDGCRVVLFGFSDSELQQMLQESGAVLCSVNATDVDLIVLDSTSVDADSLRKHLSAVCLKRIQNGEIQVTGRAQLASHFEYDDAEVRRLVTRAMLARLLGVTVPVIRSWQRRGLVKPVNTINKLDYFDFREVAAAKQLSTLMDLGLTPAAIQKNLKRLASWMPGSRRHLSQLSVQVEGQKILFRLGDGLVEAGGQRRLDFGTQEASLLEGPLDQETASILPFTGHAETTSGDESTPLSFTSPDDYLESAEELEEAGNVQEAIQIYRSLQLAFGPNADICLRIGELLFRQGDLAGARERYYTAIELDDTMVEARAALGCVLVELDQIALAISAFEGALEHHPDYADVHFQLARALQVAGEDMQALKYWTRFTELAPTGPWADEARSQIQFLRSKHLITSFTVTDS